MSWRTDAACRGMSVDLFFIERGDMAGIRAAKEVCARCYVRDECLTEALVNVEREGIFGGTTPRERTAIRMALGVEMRRPSSDHGTQNRYDDGCRCVTCSEANALRLQLQREKAARSACAS